MSTPIARPAHVDDVAGVYELLEDYVAQGLLLPRGLTELYRSIRDFIVLEDDGRIIGCASLEIFTRDLGEVRSLVVHRDYAGRGLGRVLVEHIIELAREVGLKRVMALTYVPGFFHSMNFETVSKDSLPEKVWGVCVKCSKFNDCDEIPVLLHLDSAATA